MSSPNGGKSNEHAVRWLGQVFDRGSKGKARRQYRSLILDSQSNHVTIEVITYIDKNKIVLRKFP